MRNALHKLFLRLAKATEPRISKEEIEERNNNRLKKTNETRTQNSKSKISEIIKNNKDGTFKKKNGTWNISEISKALSMDRRTVKKHLPYTG